MLPARNQFTVADLVNMDGVIFLLLATARESMPGKNDTVLIVCENVLYILLKRTARRRHSLLGKLTQALLAAVRASDCSLSRNVEFQSSEQAPKYPSRSPRANAAYASVMIASIGCAMTPPVFVPPDCSA